MNLAGYQLPHSAIRYWIFESTIRSPIIEAAQTVAIKITHNHFGISSSGGGDGETRTRIPQLARLVLSHCSYVPMVAPGQGRSRRR